jgi:putative Holliday junction resolvase
LNTDSPSSGPPLSILPREGRLIGLDYGTVRVGVAISTPDQTIASPLEIYQRRSLPKDATYFAELVRENRAVGLVVGLPMHIGGEEGIKAREAREFGAWVAGLTGLPVDFADERYTSAIAEDMLREAGLTKARRKQRIDKLAAQIFLQSFLDSRQPRQMPETPPLGDE